VSSVEGISTKSSLLPMGEFGLSFPGRMDEAYMGRRSRVPAGLDPQVRRTYADFDALG
jgi:hypothetical protein